LHCVGEIAITQTDLKGLTAPRHGRIVGSDCFSDCRSLESILFEAGRGTAADVCSFNLPSLAFSTSGVIRRPVSDRTHSELSVNRFRISGSYNILKSSKQFNIVESEVVRTLATECTE
jgi:hypothetical protein